MADPKRSARETATEGESPAGTVVRYIKQLHTQCGLPFPPKDQEELTAALEALGGKGKKATPEASG